MADHGRPRRIVFTGDLGQWDKPIVRNPTTFTEADYVVMESTYGDRDHEDHGSVESQLEKVVSETVAAGGKLIIPIFAIERAQELIYHLNRLLEARHVPEVPVFLDSPMAADVNDIFRRHRECFGAAAEEIVANIVLPFVAALGDDRLHEKAKARYDALRTTSTNSLVRLAGQQLFDSAVAGKLAKTTRQQQGLMQVFQDFCLNDKSACRHCQFPELARRWTPR